jgi:Tir chaperone protein (CesT) family
MVSGLYEAILKEFSHTLKIETLEPDENNTCLIRFANGLEVYLEMDKGGENLIIGSELGVIPVGGYRENLFRLALASNNAPFPRFGTFAYSNQTESLVLFDILPSKDLRGEQVAEYIAPFVQKAIVWKKAIEKGEIPAISLPGTAGPSSGMMGLR